MRMSPEHLIDLLEEIIEVASDTVELEKNSKGDLSILQGGTHVGDIDLELGEVNWYDTLHDQD